MKQDKKEENQEIERKEKNTGRKMVKYGDREEEERGVRTKEIE